MKYLYSYGRCALDFVIVVLRGANLFMLHSAVAMLMNTSVLRLLPHIFVKKKKLVSSVI